MKWFDWFAPPTHCWFCESVIPVPWGRGWRRICDICRDRLEPIRNPCCHRCGRQTESDRDRDLCHDCQRWGQIPLEANRSVCRYNRFSKEIIWMLKFRGKEEWVEPIGEMMAERLWEIGWKTQGIAFVPLHSGRLAERGFDQAERLARVIANSTGLPLYPVLERVRQTSSQSQRGRLGRLAAMNGAFRVPPLANRRALPSSLILVDDVYTTGATLVDCARALVDAGVCKVRSLTFAR